MRSVLFRKGVWFDGGYLHFGTKWNLKSFPPGAAAGCGPRVAVWMDPWLHGAEGLGLSWNLSDAGVDLPGIPVLSVFESHTQQHNRMQVREILSEALDALISYLWLKQPPCVGDNKHFLSLKGKPCTDRDKHI